MWEGFKIFPMISMHSNIVDDTVLVVLCQLDIIVMLCKKSYCSLGKTFFHTLTVIFTSFTCYHTKSYRIDKTYQVDNRQEDVDCMSMNDRILERILKFLTYLSMQIFSTWGTKTWRSLITVWRGNLVFQPVTHSVLGVQDLSLCKIKNNQTT